VGFGARNDIHQLQTLARPSPIVVCPIRHSRRPFVTRALQAWLGHKNIQHTVRYTELAPHRFKDFWR
jgi:hypothetical protein